jgi:hypothetical protein
MNIQILTDEHIFTVVAKTLNVKPFTLSFTALLYRSADRLSIGRLWIRFSCVESVCHATWPMYGESAIHQLPVREDLVRVSAYLRSRHLHMTSTPSARFPPTRRHVYGLRML